MKKIIYLLMAACLLMALAACGDDGGEWTRTGYFQDENGNMLSVTLSDTEGYEGWFVGLMTGDDLSNSYGNVLQQEGNKLRGNIIPDYEEGEMTVTVSEEGEDGLLVEIEGGESYHFKPMDMPEATIFVTINTEGGGNIDYAEGETAPEIDTEYPYQSAQINLAEPTVHTLAAWPDEGWHFVKWTKDGADFSTDDIITVELSESADFVAVFEFDGAEGSAAEGIDYMALVNKLNPLPEGWEDALETVTITNSVGKDVEVEKKAFEAYELLRADLEENDGIYLELDSARRSVAAQQDIMDSFIEKYGADYAAKTVAQPGYSEHHTGLALDLYFKVKDENGEFKDVYYNEDMMKDKYTGIWDTIHSKLADYGFILRYLDGREHITGYGYEPWHIRYLDSVDTAKKIMAQDITFEEYLSGKRAPELTIDYGSSGLYSREQLSEAVVQIKCKFASFEGCELHSIRYAGDEANSEQNISWLNSLAEGRSYTQIAEFFTDFHTAPDIQSTMEPDTDYNDYQWWLAWTEDDGWEIVSMGY
ncbi:MAG: M15 family metallopeptidase [Oscillospiraceae bacterium]|nr:M15 family metallopeptidase [Oscillospiraceae bacterium]